MTTASASPTVAATAAPAPGRRDVTAYYIGQSTLQLGRNVFFLVFTIAFPLVMFLLFSQLFGQQSVGDTNVAALMMVALGSYGAFGAAINGGALLQVERRTGWFRQLQLTALTPLGFVTGKLVAAMLAVLPALVVVYAAGALTGVDASLGQHLASIGIVWIAMVPMVLLGVAVALWVKLEAVQAVLTIVMMLMAIAGGMIFPSQLFPAWLVSIGQWLPTHWVVQLGQWPIVGGDLPWQGVAVLAGWLAILGLVTVLGFRRAVRTSKR
jgi:ABC-2 type transport system permease protein